MLLFFHVILIFADGFHGSITFHGMNIKTLEAKKKKKKQCYCFGLGKKVT